MPPKPQTPTLKAVDESSEASAVNNFLLTIAVPSLNLAHFVPHQFHVELPPLQIQTPALPLFQPPDVLQDMLSQFEKANRYILSSIHRNSINFFPSGTYANFWRSEASDVPPGWTPTTPARPAATLILRSENPEEDEFYDRVTDESVVPDEFKCALSFAILRDPVRADDGKVYERYFIEEWLRSNHNTSPWTRERITNNFTPAVELKAAIISYLKNLSPKHTESTAQSLALKR